MLTDAKARKLKRGGKAERVGGAPGLYLKPTAKNGHGKFFLRYVSPETKKRRDMGLGTYPEVKIADARRQAFEARELLARKVDPIEEKIRDRSALEAKSRVPTFKDASIRVHETLLPGFKNVKHGKQWLTTLKTYVFPKIGNVPVDMLTTADFAECLKVVWIRKPETASRVRQRCERVMMWCVAQQLVPHNPVSSVSALLPKQKPKRDRVRHFPSVPVSDLPAVARDLFDRSDLSVGRQALLFLILTAARSGEVRGARWEDMDPEGGIWTVPPALMKTGRRHRVPLGPTALKILVHRFKFSHASPWIFSQTGAAKLSDMTLTKILRDANVRSDAPDRVATAHGFRATFRNWASENGHPRDLAERALAHIVTNETEAAYHRTDLLEQRKNIMRLWDSFVTGQFEQQQGTN